jgi:hypothetical protein
MDHRRLLALELDAIFGLDESNPIRVITRDQSLHAVLNWSSQATFIAISTDLAARLDSRADSETSAAIASFLSLQEHNVQPYAPAVPPNALLALQNALNLPASTITGGPTYIITPALPQQALPLPLPQNVSQLKSNNLIDQTTARSCPRPSNWEPNEWNDLIACKAHHPWSMAITSTNEVVCICHTPARSEGVVEAGIWTRQDFRGQGIAPATVAAWATLHLKDTVVFYSTSRENESSKTIARKLGLEEFGYIWKLLVQGVEK